MFLQQIEEFVNLSIVGSPPQKVQASQQLHELKSRPDVVSIGMNLVMSASRDDAKLFGTHLVRDFLQSGREMSLEESQSLRQAVMEMIVSALKPDSSSSSSLPAFLVNSLLYILSLCIKRDYPEKWPSAFHDILHVGQSLGWQGVDVVIKILNELEVEVVAYNEDRSRDEITHNTLIKDSMRTTSVIPDILRYLRDAIQSAAGIHVSGGAADHQGTVDYVGIASRSMLCLSSLIGWIDINLVVVELYPLIRSVLDQAEGGLLKPEALLCIYEIVKKGMDPILKADLLQRLDVLPLLVKLLPRFQGSSLLYNIDESLEDMKMFHKRVGMVIDITLVELLGCLTKFEDGLFPSKRTSFATGRGRPITATTTAASGVSQELCAVIPFVSHMLTLLVPEVVNVLHHPVAAVAATVSPSIDKLIQLYKNQRARESAIREYLEAHPGQSPWFMLQQEYTDALLVALWQQSQFPADFNLEDAASDDADDEFMEAKVEIRRLLINCARVNPGRFLQMVTCFLNELPQPLSKAPVPAIDICLHALQALDNAVLDQFQDAFHLLFTSLTQQSDLAHHPHMLIQIAFLEFSLRHFKRLNEATLLAMAFSIVHRIQSFVLLSSQPSTRRGSASIVPSKQVAIKLTNLALKIVDVYPEKWKLLLVMAPITKDTIVLGTEAFMQSLASGGNFNSSGGGNSLFPEVEVHLYEILGALSAFVTSASSWQQFDATRHGIFFASFTLNATVSIADAQNTVAQISSVLLPMLSSSASDMGTASTAAAEYHAQFVQPFQLQLLSLLGSHLQFHCQRILTQPASHALAYQATFETFLAQQMRNMIALLERFNKQYASSSNPNSAVSSGSSSMATSPVLASSPAPTPTVTMSDSHLLPLLQQFCQLTMEILVAQRHSEVIRQRVYAFLRVMIVLLPNEQTFLFVGQVLPLLLTDFTQSSIIVGAGSGSTHFCSTIESLVELLNQVMVEFQFHSVHLVQSVAHQVITALWQRIEECLSLMQSTAAGTTTLAAAALVPDVTIPIKILLSFLVHISQHRLAAALFPAGQATVSSITVHLPQVLSWLIPLLQGFVPTCTAERLFVSSSKRIIKFTSLSYRRSAVIVFNNLLQHFLLDRMTATSAAFSSGTVSNSALAASNLPADMLANAEQEYLLQCLLLEEVLPTCLLSLGSAPGTQMVMAQRHSSVNPSSATGESNMEYEHIKLNLQDAATQSVLVEIAALLHQVAKFDQLAMYAGRSWPASVTIARSGVSIGVGSTSINQQYLPFLLTQWLCWSPESMQLLCATLWPATAAAAAGSSNNGSMMAIGPFREQFKQFLRQYLA